MESNPVTEEVNKVAEETGAQVENVAEGTISKEEMEHMNNALEAGAKMIFSALKMEGITLTDQQKEKIKSAYQASFAITMLLMK